MSVFTQTSKNIKQNTNVQTMQEEASWYYTPKGTLAHIARGGANTFKTSIVQEMIHWMFIIHTARIAGANTIWLWTQPGQTANVLQV